MKEFEYLSFWTEYSCTGDIKKSMSKSACFGYVFANIKEFHDIKYRINLYPGISFCKNKHRSNACLFSKHEIRNHIRQLKDLYPFSYKVLDRVENGVQIIAVYLNLKDVPVLFHKYILTWVRYLYEFPYNVLLRDAYWLKEDPQFRFQALSKIFNIVTYCNRRYVGEGHSIREAHLHVPMTKKDLRERIAEAIKLNDIYEALFLEHDEVPYIIEKFSYKDIEYWSREFFDTIRKPVYINLFNQIK